MDQLTNGAAQAMFCSSTPPQVTMSATPQVTMTAAPQVTLETQQQNVNQVVHHFQTNSLGTQTTDTSMVSSILCVTNTPLPHQSNQSALSPLGQSWRVEISINIMQGSLCVLKRC